MSPSSSFDRWGNALATLLIVASLIIILLPRSSTEVGEVTEESLPAGTLTLLELQGKLLIGLGSIERSAVEEQLETLTPFAASPAGAKAVAALQSYFLPRGEREKALTHLPPQDQQTAEEALLRAAILTPSSLTAKDRESLAWDLGWFHQLPLATIDPHIDKDLKQESRQLLVLSVVALTLVAFTIGAGGILLIIAIYRSSQGKLPRRFQPPQDHASVYYQAFAVYLGTMLLLSALASMGKGVTLLGSSMAMLISLLAGLSWPLLRGIPKQQLRRDLGLHQGSGALKEIGSGLVAYVTLLPILGLGFFGTLLLQALAKLVSGGESEPISHPIYEVMPSATPSTLFLVFFLASVMAPLTEEIMFRGALYRSLRGWFPVWGALLLMAFLFAAVHPQGIFAIPSLMAMAVNFGLMREWRDSLIAGIVTHGLHNGTLLLMVTLALGG
ncbi:MAG: CPBP family intramembrane glutamic endopeptidase [Verrucomicrobiota bacterium]